MFLTARGGAGVGRFHPRALGPTGEDFRTEKKKVGCLRRRTRDVSDCPSDSLPPRIFSDGGAARERSDSKQTPLECADLESGTGTKRRDNRNGNPTHLFPVRPSPNRLKHACPRAPSSAGEKERIRKMGGSFALRTVLGFCRLSVSFWALASAPQGGRAKRFVGGF